MNRKKSLKQTKVHQHGDKAHDPRPAQGAYTRINRFFERNERMFFIVSMILGALMSILLFDIKVSLSGDDCDYIINAQNFWRDFRFPGFRGPLYPIVLSPFVGLFGIKLILLKSLSAVFILLSLWLTYKSFRGIVPAVVLMPALLLTSLCSFVFFYASHTYSEPMFMLTQALFLYFFSNYFLRNSDASYTLKTDWKKYFILGALALCMGLTRSIGYAVIGAVALFFMVKLRWKDLLYTVTVAVLVFAAFQLFKTVVWPEAGSAYDIRNYLAKDYYAPNQGMEDLAGFMNRFLLNSQIYLSAFLCQMMGLVRETPSNLPEVDVWRTVIIYLLYFAGLAVVFRRNMALLFVGIYIGVMNFASFVLLQIIWGQDRLIMIYYPLILLFLLGGLCYLFQSKPLRKFFFIYPVLLLVVCGGTLIISKNRVARNIPVLQQNMLGETLYGLTPDWQNFIKASQWAAHNLEKDAVIVSRKASISKIYADREFTGLPATLTVPIDTLEYLKNSGKIPFIVVIDKRALYGEQLQYIITSMTPVNIGGREVNQAGVYLVADSLRDHTAEMLNNAGMVHTNDLEDFIRKCREVDPATLRIYDPDMMNRYLVERGIDYLLLPQLRSDPTQNNGVYINSIHRYVWFISHKYEGRFQTVKTFGTSEPCEIVKFIH